MFFRPIAKTRWPLWPLIGWDIFNFSTGTFKRNSTKLDGKQDLNVLCTIFFFFFGLVGKTRWTNCPLIGWGIFNFSSETFERNSTKLDRKQDISFIYQVCVFRPIRNIWWPPWPLICWDIFDFSSERNPCHETWQEGRSQCPLPSLYLSADRENKMAAFASDRLRHFRLLLWNRWTDFNETWQEARYQCPLLSLCFSGRLEKQDGRPGLWLTETFSTSPLEPLNGIQRNLTGSNISTSSAKFMCVCVFYCWSEKQDGRTGLWLAETFSTSPLKPLNGVQRNLTGRKSSTFSAKFMFFRADRKNKMAALAAGRLRHCRFLLPALSSLSSHPRNLQRDSLI